MVAPRAPARLLVAVIAAAGGAALPHPASDGGGGAEPSAAPDIVVSRSTGPGCATRQMASCINQLFTVDEDGSNARQVTNCPHGCVQPSWSPDGSTLAFCEATPHGLCAPVPPTQPPRPPTLVPG